MSDLIDPMRDAKKQAKRQEQDLKLQRQKQTTAKAEATGELERKKFLASSPDKGRRSLISGAAGRPSLG